MYITKMQNTDVKFMIKAFFFLKITYYSYLLSRKKVFFFFFLECEKERFLIKGKEREW